MDGVNNIYGIPFGGPSANGAILAYNGVPSSGELRFGIAGEGGGQSHTHLMANHIHTIPYTEFIVWTRVA